MKENITKIILKIFLLCLICRCGENVSTIEKIDLTDKIILKEIISDDDSFNLRLNEISVLNAVPDSVIYKSHDKMGLSIDLELVNENNFGIEVDVFKTKLDIPNFKWIIKNEKINDTVYFFNEELASSSIFLKPNEEKKISLESTIFLFEDIFGHKKNYTSDITEILSNFKLTYQNNGEMRFVSQSANTKIVIYNRKSKWVIGNDSN